MLTLHYAPDNASLIVRIVLHELGLPFRTVLVDRATRQQDSAAFRALNPAGLIPVLETPQGPLAETAAILLWLAEWQGRMAPPPGDPGRGAFLQALFLLSNTLHADLRMVFYPQSYAPGAEALLHRAVTQRLRGHYAVLEGWAGQGRLAGEPPGILDVYAAVTMRWAALYAPGGVWFDPAPLPRLTAMAARLETRPSVQAAALAEGLGDAPFTRPRPCQPPEGSATG